MYISQTVLISMLLCHPEKVGSVSHIVSHLPLDVSITLFYVKAHFILLTNLILLLNEFI